MMNFIKLANDLYHDVKRYYASDIASVIVGVYIQSVNSNKWPCEGKFEKYCRNNVYPIFYKKKYI